MNRKIRSTIVAITVVASLAISQAASAAPQYSVIDLGTLGGTYGSAQDVNKLGQVVGSSTNAAEELRAFLWSNDVMTDLGTLPDSTGSAAAGINDAGQVVGTSYTVDGAHAFIWQEGVMTDLGSLRPTDHWVTAEAINNLGQVVGNSSPAPGDSDTHAFLWQNGTMTDLGSLGGGFTSATDINDSGQVVGASNTSAGEGHAFLWENGTMIDLGTLGGASSSARAINKHAEVVGYSDTASGDFGQFLWRKGAMTDLGGQVEVLDINDQGLMVGAEFQGERAYLMRKGTLIELAPPGGYGAVAWAINDKGLIVGSATTASLDWHAVLWTK